MVVMIIDYGMGNLRSVANAFAAINVDAQICSQPSQLNFADRIILPGVGAFGEGMANLRRNGWDEAIYEQVLIKGKPFLGICLGMQLLATTGTEHGNTEGLNLIGGNVEKITSEAIEFRLPHIGWNSVSPSEGSQLYRGFKQAKDFYFVHSYAFIPQDVSVVSGVCDYYTDFVASIEKDNIFGTQYHPEKSQHAGLAVLENFVLYNAG
ncbi:imidazole glycerol phosphate synthase subunit HisH [Dendrosporobacter sp. 1207_IL3150]|uniref:imidazole glycerol phosphate synthase subunit HisH n=1 Tax=Dendrosporobacter sp. 1207_IL3150 TaxID=3084054 RepID=UPI002FDA0883